jgi:osmotically inducible protein OsmC
MATRSGSAEWKGDLPSGAGELTVGEGVFHGNYSFKSRFEEGEGTNPEELIAAAHSACYAMAFSNMLAEEGHTPDSVKASAKVHLRNVDGAPTIAQIDLSVEGVVPGIDETTFKELAEKAKMACPVSRALAGVNEIGLVAALVST